MTPDPSELPPVVEYLALEEELMVTTLLGGLRRRGIAAVALAASFLALAGCGSGRQSIAASPDEGTQSRRGSSGNEIVMRLIAYRPRTLTVPAGTAVTWSQQDPGFHTVTSGSVSKDASGSVATSPDGTFDSGRLARGKEFTFTFSEGGTYTYFCEIHPATMSGRIEVE